MLGLRIQPLPNDIFRIDIHCDCGNTTMENRVTEEELFGHEITLGGETVLLRCKKCQTGYRLIPQSDHVHVETTAS